MSVKGQLPPATLQRAKVSVATVGPAAASTNGESSWCNQQGHGCTQSRSNSLAHMKRQQGDLQLGWAPHWRSGHTGVPHLLATDSGHYLSCLSCLACHCLPPCSECRLD